MKYPALAIFLTMLWFFLMVLWIFLLVRVLLDLFRDETLSGWAKAGWVVFLIVVPFVAVLVYLIVRGRGMSERSAKRAAAAQEDLRTYVQAAAVPDQAPSVADEIAKLATLRDRGALTEQEFQSEKSKRLAV